LAREEALYPRTAGAVCFPSLAALISLTLIILVAFVAGFRVALVLGGLVYLAAWGLLARKSAWEG
jgi:hypothetical protein